MQPQPYRLSFTAASLLRTESVHLAHLHERLSDWETVREIAVADNLLQARKTASARRISRELILRLQHLSDDERTLLRQGNPDEQNQILWIAICRSYRLIAEFTLDVLRERFLSFGVPLTLADFDRFYDCKADWTPELEQLAPVTRKKLRQVLLRMLREASLISANGSIQPSLLGERLCRIVGQTRPTDLLYFNVFEADLVRNNR